MERIDFLNVKRLLWCCEDFGITIGDLALESGVSLNTIEVAVKTGNGLTFNQLQRIAKYFGRGVLFFLDPSDIEDETVHSLEFRTLANQKPQLSPKLRGLIERVETQRNRYISLIEDDYEGDSPEFQMPTFSSERITDMAAETREWLGLETKNSFDSYREALENKGILVFQSNGYDGDWQIPKENPVLGFTLYHSEYPVIVVKKRPSAAQQTFTLAHELAHLLLHRSSSIDEVSDFESHSGHEKEANEFAGMFLVPDRFLDQINHSAKPSAPTHYADWLGPLKRQLGVSTEVILRRLLDKGKITQREYSGYRKWSQNLPKKEASGGSRQYRDREPKHIFGSRYVKTVIDAKNARRITLSKASSYLDNLKVSHIKELERYLAAS